MDIMGDRANVLGNRGKPRPPQQIHDYRADNGKVHQRMPITHRSGILLQHHIFGPMQAIFNVSVLTDALGKALGCQGL